MWRVDRIDLKHFFLSFCTPSVVCLVLGLVFIRLLLIWVRALGRIYGVEASPDTLFLYGGFGMGVGVGLVVVFWFADRVTRIRLLFCFIFTLLCTLCLAFLGSFWLWWVDPFVHERVVWVFGEVKLVKHFWPNAQLMEIGESILRSREATHLPISLLAIAANSNHDADTFRALLEQEIVAKQSLVQSWWWWVQSTLGVVGLSPGHAALSVGFQVLYYGLIACAVYAFSYTLHHLLFSKAVAVEVGGSSVAAVPSTSGTGVVNSPIRDPQAVLESVVAVSRNHSALLNYWIAQTRQFEQNQLRLQARLDSKFAPPSYGLSRLYPQVTTSSVIPFSGTGQAVGGGPGIGPHISRLLLENMG